MDVCTAYSILDAQILEVAKSINVLNEAPTPTAVSQIRLEEVPFVVTDEIKRNCAAVTAHNLEQYKNVQHSIKLKEDVTSWIDVLLEVDEREEME